MTVRMHPTILGMLREAERQLKSSLMDQDMVVTYLELVKARRRSTGGGGGGIQTRYRGLTSHTGDNNYQKFRRRCSS